MNILTFILMNLGPILNAVVSIENAVKAPGATKKAIVMNSIQIAAQAGQKITNQQTQAISTVVDQTVQALNQSGVFQTSQAQTAQAPQGVTPLVVR